MKEKPTITFQEFQSKCKNFTRERIEQYIERKGLSWFQLLEIVDNPGHNRERFQREVDEVVAPELHSRMHPSVTEYRFV